MAAFCKHVGAEFCLLSRSVLSGICSNYGRSQALRCLYTQEALGIDNYVKARERINSQFANITDKFRNKMVEFSGESSTNMIFTEDLKNMVHLVESNPSDMELILKMMRRFNNQNKNLRFGNFIFGPVVMRMFHYLNEYEAAYNAFKDPQLDGFFDQISSFQVLVDLLYTNGEYDKVLEVFDIIQDKQIQGSKYPRNVVTMIFATYYKLNTPESLKMATQLWSELQKVGHVPMRRAATFASFLAIKQNAPHIALEILSGQRNQNYVTVRNLKIWALSDLGRPEDAFPLLRSVLEFDDPSKKITVSKESFEKLKAAVERGGRNDLAMEFEQLEKRLVAGDYLDDNLLDDVLCVEIKPRFPDQDRGGQFVAASFNRQRGIDGPQRPRNFQRPGLQQLY